MTPTPDDYGLDTVRTLARVADPTPARSHSVFWSTWFRDLGAERPHLRPRDAGEDPSDPSATHEIRMPDGARIGCRLTMPEGPALAGMVTSHGSVVDETLEVASRRWRHIVDRGVAVLQVRVRGYPGSQLGVGDLTQAHEHGGWFTRGLAEGDDTPEDAAGWVVPRAVGDLANACRALRNALFGRTDGITLNVNEGARPPVYLHGESLGAGLAVIVAAQLIGRLRYEPIVDRLAVGLPTLGDWAWRLEHNPGGTGAEVAALLDRLPDKRAMITERVRLLDSALHAARVRRPTLVKLAVRDDVVPAPSAAAVFNALGSDPGEKWRFVVPVGHAEGGLANARRHALFERCLADFFDPAFEPDRSMLAWEPVMNTGERAPDGSAPSLASGDPAPESLFGAQALPREQDAALVRAYEQGGRTLDSLPYTPEMSAIMAAVSASFTNERDVLHRLQNLRKAGRLPKLGRAPERPPTIEPGQEDVLRGLIVDAAGSLGARDRLPHTAAFDGLVDRFNRETGLSLAHHDVWRIVAKLAK